MVHMLPHNFWVWMAGNRFIWRCFPPCMPSFSPALHKKRLKRKVSIPLKYIPHNFLSFHCPMSSFWAYTILLGQASKLMVIWIPPGVYLSPQGADYFLLLEVIQLKICIMTLTTDIENIPSHKFKKRINFLLGYVDFYMILKLKNCPHFLIYNT